MARPGWSGVLKQIGIRAVRCSSVALPDKLCWVAGDVTNWYQSHGFNTEPGWARKVEVEEKVSGRKLLSKWTKLKFRAQFSTLSLN
jgi:hypothetical protein